MATMLLRYAGSAIGGMIGGPAGALLGGALGSLAGAGVDNALFGRTMRGPRLQNLQVMGASEGAGLPALWGRARIAGQVIWAAPIKEHKKSYRPSKTSPSVTNYTYTASFAVALCEGPISRIGRIWADGNEIDPGRHEFRLYKGSETQLPDSLIAASVSDAPAYRGVAYVVFPDLPLGPFGNRVPQLSFEVYRNVSGVGGRLPGICIIPGAGEFVYDTAPVRVEKQKGKTVAENFHLSGTKTDFTIAMNQLQSACPSLQSAALVVSWFGSGLDAATCKVEPAVDDRLKKTLPESWRVAGMTRANARLTSRVDGRPAYGGTPTDASVRRAIADLKARGLKLVFYPFLLMDCAGYPWRGDIKPVAAADVAAFFGAAKASDFTIVNGEVAYGGSEWSWSRMVLHYAKLCQQAGGVDAFLIGSEMRGLTRWRAPDGTFPAVAQLIRLAAEVKKILPAAKVSYAADWSEYGGLGIGNDLFFPLDPLWASPSVDFIGIDNYFPLSDWRNEPGHLDQLAGWASRHDADYLTANAGGGEYYDWYYASQADRDAQRRTPITDGAYNKPWVWRAKDVKGWWQNAHVERRGGVELATPTAWVPASKPVWFTEVGCPAVDKGANAPHLFVDAKSSASGLPFYSRGLRDDDIQRRYVEAVMAHWAKPAANPVSSLYGGPMVDTARIHAWCWDARAWPAFPRLTSVWADGVNHARGHWLNGRLDNAPVADVIEAVLARFGVADADASPVRGTIEGYVIDKPMSAREALEPLLEAFAVDAVETGGSLEFRMRGLSALHVLKDGDLVEADADKPLKRLARAEGASLPVALSLAFSDPARDYQPSAVEARRRARESDREMALDLFAVMPRAEAEARAAAILQDQWAGREQAEFVLPPSRLAVEPGDGVALEGASAVYSVTGLAGGLSRRVNARAVEASLFDPASLVDVPSAFAALSLPSAPWLAVLDYPGLEGGLRIAAASDPWAESLALTRREAAASFRALDAIRMPAVMGLTLDALQAGPLWRMDRKAKFRVRLTSGSLASVSLQEMLGGANRALVGDELIQFTTARLVEEDTYEISGLLRGQGGSEPEMKASLPAGATFVMIDEALADAGVTREDMGRALEWRAGPLSRDMGDESWSSVTATHRALSLRPLSPVQFRRKRAGAAWSFSWLRRTRAGGDAWVQGDVPLGEESESWRVEFCRADGTLLRAETTAAANYLYTDAKRAADFGANPYRLRIAQISGSYGPGAFLEVNLNG